MDAAQPSPGTGRDLARLLAGVLAVLVAGLAYRDHLDPSLPWWRWMAGFTASAALLVAAFGDEERDVEIPARVALRGALGCVALAATAAMIYFLPNRGSELTAGIAGSVAIGAAMLARWVPFARAAAVELSGSDRPTAPPAWPILIARALLVALAAVTALLAFQWQTTDHRAAFLAWIASLALFAAACWRREIGGDRWPARWRESAGPELARSTELALFTAILIAATLLRTVVLEDIPYNVYEDEGRQGRYAARMWKDGFPDAFGVGWNAFGHLSYMVEHIPVQLLGVSRANARLSTAIVGVLSLIPAYFWIRRWWGNVVALIATALLAANHEHIFWSRMAVNNIHQVFVGALMLATFARALRRRAVLDWVWFGYATGLGFHTYHSAKLYPALLGAAALIIALGLPRFLRRHAAGAIAATAATVLMLGPLAATMVRGWDGYYSNTSNRVDLHVLQDAYARGDVTHVRAYIHDHVAGCLLSFLSVPDQHYAFFNAAVAPLFVIGIGWLLWRWRDPRHVVLLMWLGGILVIGGMITNYPPWVPRLLGFLPVACLVPALVVGRLRGLALRVWPRRADEWIAAIIVVWLAAATYLHADTEFRRRTVERRGGILTAICHAIEDAPLPVTVYMMGGRVMGEPLVAMHDCMIGDTPERIVVNRADEHTLLPVPPDTNENALILIAPEQAESVARFLQYYPTARVRQFNDGRNEVVLHAVTVPRDVIRRAQGLGGVFSTGQRTWNAPAATAELDASGATEWPVRAAWSGSLWVPDSGYRVRVRNGHLRVWDGADDEEVIFAPGWHEITAAAELADANARIVLEWRAPGSAWEQVPSHFLNSYQSARGLRGHYDMPPASPSSVRTVAERMESAIAFDWFDTFRAPANPPYGDATHFTWSGNVRFDAAGVQRLRLQTTYPAQVAIDGRVVIEAATDGALVDLTASAATQQQAAIEVTATRPAQSPPGEWRIRLLWGTPDGGWTPFADYRP